MRRSTSVPAASYDAKKPEHNGIVQPAWATQIGWAGLVVMKRQYSRYLHACDYNEH
jgi:hypothetical protein